MPSQKKSVALADGGEPKYGKRADGTAKGEGYFGLLKRPDGDVSTELSIGVEMNGKETEIPTLVPTLHPAEVQYLLDGGRPTDAIVNKAVDFAQRRMSQGLSPFAQPGERNFMLRK